MTVSLLLYIHYLKYISIGALRLSDSLIKGAEATGRAIHKGAAKIRDQLTPEETPSEVSPSTTKRLEMARKATGGAVRVSQFLGEHYFEIIQDIMFLSHGISELYFQNNNDYLSVSLVNGVGTVAEKLAEKMAPHVKKHGAKLVPEALKKKEDGQASKMDGAKFVAVSTVHGMYKTSGCSQQSYSAVKKSTEMSRLVSHLPKKTILMILKTFGKIFCELMRQFFGGFESSCLP